MILICFYAIGDLNYIKEIFESNKKILINSMATTNKAKRINSFCLVCFLDAILKLDGGKSFLTQLSRGIVSRIFGVIFDQYGEYWFECGKFLVKTK